MSNAPQDCKVNNAVHVKINVPRAYLGVALWMQLDTLTNSNNRRELPQEKA